MILAYISCRQRNEELWLDDLVVLPGSHSVIDVNSFFKMNSIQRLPERFILKTKYIKPERERKDIYE